MCPDGLPGSRDAPTTATVLAYSRISLTLRFTSAGSLQRQPQPTKASSGVVRRGRGALEFEDELVGVAVVPLLAGLEGADDRVLRRVVMLGGVAVRGGVARANVGDRRAPPQ